MTTPLAATARVHEMLREQLLERHPELAEDEQCLLDTLEGMTSLNDQLAELARSSLRDQAMANGIATYQARLADRKTALEGRALRKRGLVTNIMSDLGIKRVEAPDLSITRKPVAPKVEIIDDDALPDKFVRVTVTRSPDKVAIKAALTAGETVDGALLSNGGETIAVKV